MLVSKDTLSSRNHRVFKVSDHHTIWTEISRGDVVGKGISTLWQICGHTVGNREILFHESCYFPKYIVMSRYIPSKSHSFAWGSH